MLQMDQKTSLERQIERFREISEASGGDLTATLALGEASLRRGLRLEALNAFQRVIRAEDSVVEAHLAIAQIFSQQRMFAEAYDELGRVLELDPDNLEARLLALELQEAQEPPDALREALDAIVVLSAFERTRIRLGVLKRLAERDFQERTRNLALESAEPLHEYYVEEAKKRLTLFERLLEGLEHLEEETRRRQLEPPAPELIAPRLLEAEAQPVESPELDLEPDFGPQPEPAAAAEAFGMDHSEELAQVPDLSESEFAFEEQSPELQPIAAFEGASEPGAVEASPEIEPPAAVETDPEAAVLSVREPIAPEVPEFDEVLPPVDEAPTEPPPEADQPSLEPEAIPDEAAPAAAAGPTPGRLEFYSSLSADLGDLTGTLSKTRGVTSIYVVSRDGYLLEHSSKDDVAPERICAMVVEALDFLESFAPDPQYWVLECDGGILVMQTVDAMHVLVAVGQAGANFGALRYTMDKTRPRFAQLFEGMPD